MKTTKVLFNISNHPSSSWSEEQKAGWDEIIDIPFPEVNPNWDTNDLGYQRLERDLRRQIYDTRINIRLAERCEDVHIGICLQGEFSLCYRLFKQLHNEFSFYIPTTERKVVENPDGTKISKFKFVRWRVI